MRDRNVDLKLQTAKLSLSFRISLQFERLYRDDLIDSVALKCRQVVCLSNLRETCVWADMFALYKLPSVSQCLCQDNVVSECLQFFLHGIVNSNQVYGHRKKYNIQKINTYYKIRTFHCTLMHYPLEKALIELKSIVHRLSLVKFNLVIF